MSDNTPIPQQVPDTNPYASLISQQITIIPSFTLESGVTLNNVPVAYKTWGKLNKKADNCLVICHALTGSADVEDWYVTSFPFGGLRANRPLVGGDPCLVSTRHLTRPDFSSSAQTLSVHRMALFLVSLPTLKLASLLVPRCPEVASRMMFGMPCYTLVRWVLTKRGRLHYIVLKSLGVKSVAAVVGGSMGGMTVLEYPLNTPPGFVRAIIPLATSARHSAWCISWGEAQRQSIYSDPDYKDGYYYEIEEEEGKVDLARQPARGLAAARMAALLTYRSRDSFESRFGRRSGGGKSSVPKGGVRIMGGQETTDPSVPSASDLAAKSPSWRAWREHNDGHRSAGTRPVSRSGSEGPARGEGDAAQVEVVKTQEVKANGSKIGTGGEAPPKIFSAQSYLRYQGDKVRFSMTGICKHR